MKDREFLTWIHARLEHHYGDSPALDFMHKLRGIVKATPPDRDSPTFSGCLADEPRPMLVKGRKLRRK